MNEREHLQELAGILAEKAKVGSACHKKFGEVLFGEFDKWYKTRAEQEPNTAVEEDYWGKLIKWVNGNYMEGNSTATIKAMLMDLKKCVGDYDNILKPEDLTMYRGASVEQSEFLYNMAGFTPKQLHDHWVAKTKPVKIGIKPMVDMGVAKYTPQSEVQSWTTNKKTAAFFAYGDSGNRRLAFIIEATFPQSEILFTKRFINQVADSIAMSKEDEQIRVGKVVHNCQIWVDAGQLGYWLEREKIITSDEYLARVDRPN